MRFPTLALGVLLLLPFLTACGPRGDVATQKGKIREMHEVVLKKLYQVNPNTRTEIARAPGMAVFSNAEVNVFFLGGGGGYGLAKDAKGKETFMKMGTVNVGLGLGVNDFRVVFVFHSAQAYRDFIEKGWDFSGKADASAKAGETGGAAGGQASVQDVTIYQLTESGLAIQATLNGTKYWQDTSLNR
jgi:lipid-binding SYLF domain-containing protein